MTRAREMCVFAVAVLTLLAFASCESGGSGGGGDGSGGGSGSTDWEALFTPINLNQTYNLSIASFGTDFFKFTTTSAGSYEIAITNTSSNGDMGWQLYDRSDPLTAVFVGEADDYLDNTDEVGSLSLSGSTTYYLLTDEWQDPGSIVNYSLRVSSP